MEAPRLAVIVLNWNGRELLEKLMPNWVSQTSDPEVELIIADNHSDDDSLAFLDKHYPDVRQIRLDDNLGFAEGYNRVIAQVNAPYTLLLNSDAALENGWADEPLHLLDGDRSIAAVQPKIRSYFHPEQFEYAGAGGGFMDRWGYPYCRGRIFDTVETDWGQYDHASQDIFWASGAALFVRTSDYLEMGGLDARFFAHQEEIDLCWRFKARAKRVVFSAQSIVYHMGGASLGVNDPRKAYLNFRNNLLMLYKNLPEKEYHKVMFVRFGLDILAALMAWIKGDKRQSKAILKARKDFHSMRHEFRKSRKENIAATLIDHPHGWHCHSIVWQYYALGRKTANRLH